MNLKVLIVEDERLVAQHISQLLKSQDYQICAIASDGETALKKIAEFYPDLILLDIRIKGEIDGIEVAQKIDSLYDIPIIYLTAFSDLETIKRAQSTNPAGYVVKPFRREQLLSTVAIALANQDKKQKDRLPETSPEPEPSLSGAYRLQPTLSYIQDHLNDSISVEFLARAINMSPAYFSRYFQQEMGCSPYQFIIQQRIQKAKDLLKQRDLNINEIALQCGFSSHSQLNRHFRTVVGITPKEYRNS